MTDEFKFIWQGNRLLLIVLLLASFFSIWKLGSTDVEDWDEARQIVTAVEMAHRGNYIDYYYGDEIDTWNSKPPLLIWSMTASYQLFGPSVFSSRLPSALASIVFLVVVFSLVSLYRSKLFAFGTCLILMSSRAVFEAHIGRTADFDGFLILFLAAFAYFFLLYHDFGYRWAILVAGAFLGLAFYSKGTTSVFLLPGTLVFVLLSGTFRKVLKDPNVWLAFLIYVGMASSWFYLSGKYGASFDASESHYGSDGALSTMLINDTWQRFIGQGTFGEERGTKPFYFFVILDILMGLWSYIFYAGVILGAYQLFRGNWKEKIRSIHNKPLLFSTSMILTVMLILDLSAVKLGWYYAPIFMFVAILTMETIAYISEKIRPMKWVFGGLFLVLLIKQFLFINSRPAKTTSWLEENAKEISGANCISVDGELRPSVYASLKLRNYNTHLLPSNETCVSQGLMVLRKGEDPAAVNLSCNEEFCLVKY